ncbi:hypothetical protein [Vibrio coralliilyticus]|uniref:Uncharacterized protein n=1 Tax=Vibrio coralliilyticus TaxID=190893 RepID=A0AAP7DG37_9VIBR|nr:hypothetical protein [Vibrio coralliilyticus]NOI31826.1 hypothetical protein [Vibrio coralliilyticus]NOJ25270.1 hypothetical protein [Vibrio coralliilyticus]
MAEKLFSKSLAELVESIESTIPHAKKNGYLGVSADMSLDVAQELLETLARIKRLDTENDRLVNSLDYILESGSIASFEAEQKAKWGLGLDVEDESKIAALKPRFS